MANASRISGLSGNLPIKVPVRVATTAAITLDGEQTIDGIAVVENDRVLVKDQADATENGIYDVRTGTWSRSKDFNGSNDAVNGTLMLVATGTVNGSIFFRSVASVTNIVVGTTEVSFTQQAIGLEAVVGSSAESDFLLYSAGDNAFVNKTLAQTQAILGIKFNKDDAIVAPTASNDSSEGFTVGSRWTDVVAKKFYFCVKDTVGLAEWDEGDLQITDLGGAATKEVAFFIVQDYLAGLTLANDVTDPDHDIVVSAGQASNDGNTKYLKLASAMTKRLDGGWTVGNNGGGNDLFSVTNDAWYYVWLIEKDSDSTIDVLFSLSATSPTMPTGYTAKRRIGEFKTDGSGNVLPFTQKGDRFLLVDAIEDVNETNWDGSAGVLYALSVPPSTTALIRAVAEDGALWGVLFQSPNETNKAAGTVTTGDASLVGGTAAEAAGHFEIDTDASSQIRIRTNTATMNYTRVYTYGWISNRGK